MLEQKTKKELLEIVEKRDDQIKRLLRMNVDTIEAWMKGMYRARRALTNRSIIIFLLVASNLSLLSYIFLYAK